MYKRYSNTRLCGATLFSKEGKGEAAQPFHLQNGCKFAICAYPSSEKRVPRAVGGCLDTAMAA